MRTDSCGKDKCCQTYVQGMTWRTRREGRASTVELSWKASQGSAPWAASEAAHYMWVVQWSWDSEHLKFGRKSEAAQGGACLMSTESGLWFWWEVGSLGQTWSKKRLCFEERQSGGLRWMGGWCARAQWPRDRLEDSGKGRVRNDEAEGVSGVWWRPLEGMVQEQKQQDFKAAWQWGEGPGEKGRAGSMFHRFFGCFSVGTEAPSQHLRPLASSQVPHSLMGYREQVSSTDVPPDQQIRRNGAPWVGLREKGQWPLFHLQTTPSSVSWINRKVVQASAPLAHSQAHGFSQCL